MLPTPIATGKTSRRRSRRTLLILCKDVLTSYCVQSFSQDRRILEVGGGSCPRKTKKKKQKKHSGLERRRTLLNAQLNYATLTVTS